MQASYGMTELSNGKSVEQSCIDFSDIQRAALQIFCSGVLV